MASDTEDSKEDEEDDLESITSRSSFLRTEEVKI